MKKSLIALCALIVVCSINPASAAPYTFSKDFTVSGFDLSDWTRVFDGTWTHTPGGPVHGVPAGPPGYSTAAIHYTDLPEIDTTGIFLSAVFDLHSPGSLGIFFGASPKDTAGPSPGPDDYDRITIGIASESGGTGLFLYNNGAESILPLPHISTGTKLVLDLEVNQANVLHWKVWEYTGAADPLAFGDVPGITALTGLAGLYTDSVDGDFYAFTVHGNAVPVPSGIFLLGAGVLCLAGWRRKAHSPRQQ